MPGSTPLIEQATHDTQDQLEASPDLSGALPDAVIDPLDAHTAMSRQALGSSEVQARLLDILLFYAGHFEELRAAGRASLGV